VQSGCITHAASIALRLRSIDLERGTDPASSRIMKTSLLRSILFVALVGGCAGGFTYASDVTVPELIAIRPGVQVIANLDEPIFYTGNYYWRNQGGTWYRSTSHRRGWARIEVVPVEIRSIERPAAYIHYRGEARARVDTRRD
jgi:hypothetical protein